MKRNNYNDIPYLEDSFEFYDFTHGHNSFDPMGSYTGRTPESYEKPVQDADDL